MLVALHRRAGWAWRRQLVAALLLAASCGAPAQEAGGCPDYNPLRNVYTGDLHVHTALSLDAATQDTRARPADAYRFARGEPLAVQPYDDDGRALRELRLARALDFAAVTDHAELLGEVSLCQTPGSATHDSWQCLLYRHVPRAAYYLFNFTASRNRRLGNCGEDGAVCREAAAGPWSEIRQAAADALDASGQCRFTSFVAYEWTGTRGGNAGNMHRNVIFRGDVVPRLPISFVDTGSPEKLWEMLDSECRAGLPGCEVLAIPHNSNLSGGYMFDGLRVEGTPYTAADAALRARSEPLFEIVQHKGASECYAGSSAGIAADEYCGFEQLPYDAFAGQNFESRRQAPGPETGFFREILRDGLRLEKTLGTDPYRMGVIGSTDTHLGAAGGVSEADFIGHGGAGVPARDGVPQGLPDSPEFGPGGLAMIWAEQNTREALFAAMQRRETYATSGTRPQLRFFGGWDFPADFCASAQMVREAYARGVPMGGELERAAGSVAAPVFVVAALRDPLEGSPLQQLQLVKGWVDAQGESRERVVTLASADAGADSLCAVWRDPAYEPGDSAWYYVRLLEMPTPRWSARICAANKVDCADPGSIGEGLEVCCSPEHRDSIQERAWSSPIWVSAE
ncbi:MAG: DUF3604 domain-containing protein [Gammaproteobacteria bacterium]|nr:DUF3604 domain-containing protein [Gammaproteobacteria bacterium]